MIDIFEVVSKEEFEKYEEIINNGLYNDVSLVLAVINSVFSISARYESTIKVVNRFADYVGIDRSKDEYTTSQFMKQFYDVDSEILANDVFGNRQRTSAVNGILKAEATKQVIKVLNDNKIETQKDLLHCEYIDTVEMQIRRVKGQSSGITFEYLMMNVGDDNRFKPDRHIYTFFGEYLKYGSLTEEKLREVFFNELEKVKEKYPYFTARSFDSLIWTFIKSTY
ncbi:MAG: hypothetical protein ACOX5Y_04625 [Acholeplasmataceae bacterium]